MKDLFLAQCFMELSLSEEAVSIYATFCGRGFARSVYVKSQLARCYDNLREGQACKETFEAIRKLDPCSLDFMDIYSNILFVMEEHAQLAVLAQEACEIDKYRPESCCIIGNLVCVFLFTLLSLFFLFFLFFRLTLLSISSVT